MNEKPRINLNNISRAYEMIKYEIHLQDVRIKELESLLVTKNQEITKLKEELTTLESKYTSIFGAVTRLGLGK